ncbi:MAG: GTPase Era [Candidatus Omnitrophota bacterium]
MSEKLALKSGIVAIVGRSNTGKSTLMNHLVGEKVAIVSATPQTTRTQIRAILNEKRGQIVFLDTPGMHICRHALDRAMIVSIQDALMGADVVLHLVDMTRRVGQEEISVIKNLSKVKAPIILGLNKTDKGFAREQEYILAWEKNGGLKSSTVIKRVFPLRLSALTGFNVDCLLDELFQRLPIGDPLYPDDVLTDFPRQLAIQDMIREKLLGYLKEEIPFSIAVLAEEIIDRNPKLMVVNAVIFVERSSQKAIVIGHRGELLKKAGQAARHEIEEVYGKKVYLDLWVKVEAKWKQDHQLLRRIGYVM